MDDNRKIGCGMLLVLIFIELIIELGLSWLLVFLGSVILKYTYTLKTVICVWGIIFILMLFFKNYNNQ